MTKKLTKFFSTRFKLVFAMVICLITILGVLSFRSCNNSQTIESKFYLVYAQSFQSAISAEQLAKEVESQGGAGNIYSAGSMQYVIVNAYVSREDAKKVANNIQKKYATSGILELNCTVLKNAKSAIFKDNNAKNYYKLLINLCKKLSEYSIKYDLNQASLSEICRQLITDRQSLLIFTNNTSGKNQQTNEKIKASANLMLSYIDNFYHNIFSSSSYATQIKKLLVWSTIEAYQIKNML